MLSRCALCASLAPAFGLSSRLRVYYTLYDRSSARHCSEIAATNDMAPKAPALGVKKKGTKFYAVRKGARTGIFHTWDECQKQVTGYRGALFKSFQSQAEAEAWIAEEYAAEAPAAHAVADDKVPSRRAIRTIP